MMGDMSDQVSKKIRSYRFAMKGSIFMVVMAVIGGICMWINDPDDIGQLVSVYTSLFFWPMLAYVCKLKIEILQLKQTLHDTQN